MLPPATAPKPESDDTEPEEGYENVRESWCKSYVAGKAIEKYGLKSGITEDMEIYAEMEFYGECDYYENDDGTPELDEDGEKQMTWRFFPELRAAWHAIRAYTGQIPSAKPEPEDVQATVQELEKELAKAKARLQAMNGKSE